MQRKGAEGMKSRRWLRGNRALMIEAAPGLGHASAGDGGRGGSQRDRWRADPQRLTQAGGRLAVYRILAVENPAATRKRWGVFFDGEQVYGPENVYDCIRWRDQRVRSIIHAEDRRPRAVRLAAAPK